MVWFHVLADKIVWCASVQCGYKVLCPFPLLTAIGGIHDGNLVINDYPTVITHPFRNCVLAFKEVYVQVVNTYVTYVVCL
jgi:hypothetical protein